MKSCPRCRPPAPAKPRGAGGGRGDRQERRERPSQPDPLQKPLTSSKGKILHKYDEDRFGLCGARACSAHCRYCYRLDLFNGSTGKGLVKARKSCAITLKGDNETLKVRSSASIPKPATSAVRSRKCCSPRAATRWCCRTSRFINALSPRRPKAALGMWSVSAPRKWRSARCASDMPNFFAATLNLLHANSADLHVNIVTHFSHPDEMLEARRAEGRYIEENLATANGWKPVKTALENMLGLGFVSLRQPDALMIKRRQRRCRGALHPAPGIEARRHQVEIHLPMPRNRRPQGFCQCWSRKPGRIHTESQKGLSDAARSRFAMSTESRPKLAEVISVTDATCRKAPRRRSTKSRPRRRRRAVRRRAQ